MMGLVKYLDRKQKMEWMDLSSIILFIASVAFPVEVDVYNRGKIRMYIAITRLWTSLSCGNRMEESFDQIDLPFEMSII